MSHPWTMAVPVISTAHCPDSGSLTALVGLRPCAPYMDGAFVYLGHPMEDAYTEPEAWLIPIADWLHELQGRECDGWVRFDSFGDNVAELPAFDWE